MTRTVEVDVLERGDTQTKVVSCDDTDRNDSHSFKTYDAVCNEIKKRNQSFESETSKPQTNEMTNFMGDLSFNSPKVRPSRSRSKTHSIKRQSSSYSSNSSRGSSSSRSTRSSSLSRSLSHSLDRKYKHKRIRRSSRSYSRGHSRSCSKSYLRNRSRSYSPHQRRRYSSAYRRHYRSPPRYRSRSRSYSRTYRGRRRSYSRTYRGRRYSRSRSPSHSRRFNGFVRRSRTRSRSRKPLQLSEKEKLKLLEVAKMNASKALGKEVDIPDSLKKILKTIMSTDKDKKSDKSCSSSSFPSGSGTVLQVREDVKEYTGPKHRSPYVLWRPVTGEAK